MAHVPKLEGGYNKLVVLPGPRTVLSRRLQHLFTLATPFVLRTPRLVEEAGRPCLNRQQSDIILLFRRLAVRRTLWSWVTAQT
jgi:hypothetical protein